MDLFETVERSYEEVCGHWFGQPAEQIHRRPLGGVSQRNAAAASAGASRRSRSNARPGLAPWEKRAPAAPGSGRLRVIRTIRPFARTALAALPKARATAAKSFRARLAGDHGHNHVRRPLGGAAPALVE